MDNCYSEKFINWVNFQNQENPKHEILAIELFLVKNPFEKLRSPGAISGEVVFRKLGQQRFWILWLISFTSKCEKQNSLIWSFKKLGKRRCILAFCSRFSNTLKSSPISPSSHQLDIECVFSNRYLHHKNHPHGHHKEKAHVLERGWVVCKYLTDPRQFGVHLAAW